MNSMKWLGSGLYQLPRSLWQAGPRAVAERIRRRVRLLLPRKSRFTSIAREGGFGGSPSLSGAGSSVANTHCAKDFLVHIIEKYGVRTILDIPCGDFWWMQHVDLGAVRYIGADIVDEIVETNERRFRTDQRHFVVKDLCADALPRVDLVLSRDCLIHLKLSEGLAALKNLKASGSDLFLLSTYPAERKNDEIDPRFSRKINLELPPFLMPRPIDIVFEDGGANEGKALGLWRNASLPGRTDA
jgi:hypothetical protein